ncbi:MAG: DUF401 family protein [Verrucomicrobiota bacterium]
MILELPILVKIMASLGLILVCNRLIGNLTVSVLLGTISLAALSGQTMAASLDIAGKRLLAMDNACLMIVIFLVIWLSTQMSETLVMRDLVEAIRYRLCRRHAMAALPAVIGFLPMPGGAIFSAPLVENCDRGGQIAPILKARANFWFRHVWEFWWPLYPGVLLAMHLTGLEIWQFILLGLPLSLAAIMGGYLFILRGIGRDCTEESFTSLASPLTKLLMPIFMVIAGYMTFRLVFGAVRLWQADVPAINRYLPMIFGILLANLVLERWRPLPWKTWRRIIFSAKTFNLALIVAAVRIYGAFIEAPLPNGATPIALMQLEMAHWGIPLVAMVMLLPFVAGVTTGLAIGFVGTSFPIVVSLMGVDPPLNILLGFTVLAYACGHMGQMLSPVHVCLVVNSEYFNTNLIHSLRGLLAPMALVILAALAVHVIVMRWL